jgi:predicted O-methyltransferase YrrM
VAETGTMGIRFFEGDGGSRVRIRDTQNAPNSGVISFDEIIREMESSYFVHPASMNIDSARFLYEFAKNVSPRLVVEIGSFVGFSTLHIAQALKENGKGGHVVGIDLFDDDFPVQESMWDGREKWVNRLEIAENFLNNASLENVVTFIKGNSIEVYKQIRGVLTNGIDLLLIDGDHSLKGVFADFNRYYNLVRPGGYIVLHDIYPENCGWDGPRILIDRLKKSGIVPRSMELIEIATPDGYGFSVCRKIDSRPLYLDIPILGQCTALMASYKKKVKSLLFSEQTKSVSRAAKICLSAYQKFTKNAKRSVGVWLSIRDSDTGKPVPEALIFSGKTGPVARADGHGNVYFSNVLPQNYSLSVFATGYSPLKDQRINIDGKTKLQRISIQLLRSSNLPNNKS